jgi:predicted transcriptional regulator
MIEKIYITNIHKFLQTTKYFVCRIIIKTKNYLLLASKDIFMFYLLLVNKNHEALSQKAMGE